MREAQDKTGETEALVVMQGSLKGLDLVACAFEFDFMGGSMGTVVGDRFIKQLNEQFKNQPLICFAASGGARMQEGMLSLMQMARTSLRFKNERSSVPYLVCVNSSRLWGVTASLAMLGDVHIAEPKAMIGFAGKRVIEQTVREN